MVFYAGDRLSGVTPPGGGSGGSEPALFRADFNSPGTHFDFAGAGSDPSGAEGSRWDRTHRATSGPSGGGCLEYEYYPVSIATINAETGNGQYFTNYATTSFASIAQGGSLYYRLYVKAQVFTNPDVWASDLGGDVEDDAWTMKWSILAGNSSNNERIITHFSYDAFPANTLAIVIGLNVEDPPNRTDGLVLTLGQWHAIQLQIKTSSTAGATNGFFKGWKDTDIEGSPSVTTPENLVVNVPAAGWTNASFNEFQNKTLALGQVPTPSIRYQIGAFEIGTTFDSTWFATMTT
jgi:hypothetical protein